MEPTHSPVTSKGFTNWRTASEQFSQHANSTFHKDSVWLLHQQKVAQPIDEQLTSIAEEIKVARRKCLLEQLKILKLLSPSSAGDSCQELRRWQGKHHAELSTWDEEVPLREELLVSCDLSSKTKIIEKFLSAREHRWKFSEKSPLVSPSSYTHYMAA